MAKKIRKIIVELNTKGSVQRPFSFEEYEQLKKDGQWKTGSFVEGLGYMEGETSSNGFTENNIENDFYGGDGEVILPVEHTMDPVIATAGKFKCKCTAEFFYTLDFSGGITTAIVYIEIDGMNNTAFDPDINNDRVYSTLSTQTSPICIFRPRGFKFTFNQEIVVNTSVSPNYNYTNKVFRLQLNGSAEMLKDANGVVIDAFYTFNAIGYLSDL